MIGLLLYLLAVAHPPDAVVDSLIRDWYETSWFAERYEVDYVAHINITNISEYGRYEYEEGQYLHGYAYTTHVGYYDKGGYLMWHKNNCFLFYNPLVLTEVNDSLLVGDKDESKWSIEAVPFLPLVDPRASPHRAKGSKI